MYDLVINLALSFTVVLLVGYIYKLLTEPGIPAGLKQAYKIPGGYPIFGHALELGKNSKQFVDRCIRAAGANMPFEINLMGKPTIVISGAMRNEFFSSDENFLSFNDAILEGLAPELTIGLGSVLDQYHVPIVRKEFGLRRIATYTAKLQKALNYTLDKVLLKDVTSVGSSTVVESLEFLAFRMVASCSATSFFGDVLGKEPEILNVFISFHSSCYKVMRLVKFFPRFLIPYLADDVNHDVATLAKYIVPEVIKRRALKLKATADKDSESSSDADLLDNFILLKNKDGELYTPEEISHRMLSMVFASMVTTAGVLTHLLNDVVAYANEPFDKSVSNETLWEALRKEQVAALNASGGVLDEDCLDNMPKLISVIRESTRMSVPSFQQSRYAKRDGELCGYYIKKGSFVFMTGTSYDPALFPEPEKFKPARFMHVVGKEPLKTEPDGLFPFGIGRHVCLGRHFAYAELKTCVTVLMQRYKLSLKDGGVPDYIWDPTNVSRTIHPVIVERVAQ